ncbi:hypothetical protein NP493_858g00022 [Ridgeia piscesae]|uniref:Uncharacterized protein n=1 Tax=Ridgeia piscesae TaxID=27915 RepID=A0AAD9KLU1_RIDPI|nr:hypothetical protein NP493_858g00022 [Ridgeia piscesae]
MADLAVIEATTGERCGNVKAPPVINFVKSLFVGASDTRTLERATLGVRRKPAANWTLFSESATATNDYNLQRNSVRGHYSGQSTASADLRSLRESTHERGACQWSFLRWLQRVVAGIVRRRALAESRERLASSSLQIKEGDWEAVASRIDSGCRVNAFRPLRSKQRPPSVTRRDCSACEATRWCRLERATAECTSRASVIAAACLRSFSRQADVTCELARQATDGRARYGYSFTTCTYLSARVCDTDVFGYK